MLMSSSVDPDQRMCYPPSDLGHIFHIWSTVKSPMALKDLKNKHILIRFFLMFYAILGICISVNIEACGKYEQSIINMQNWF